MNEERDYNHRIILIIKLKNINSRDNHIVGNTPYLRKTLYVQPSRILSLAKPSNLRHP